MKKCFICGKEIKYTESLNLVVCECECCGKYAYEKNYDNIVEHIEVTGLADGKYDLYLRAVDYAGNLSEVYEVGTYTVDNTAPIFTTDVTVPTGWTNNTQVTLPVTTDGKLTYSINGGTAVEYTKDTNVITVTQEGELEFVITASDEAGNTITKEFTYVYPLCT